MTTQALPLNAARIPVRRRWLRLLYPALIVVLTLLPVANMLSLTLSAGANLQNDEVYWIELYGDILDGGFDWTTFPGRVFLQGGHFMVFPGLIYAALAQFAALDVYVGNTLGILFALLRVLLLYDAFTFRLKSWLRWLLLPALSALAFSASQTGMFAFLMVNLLFNLVFLGFALALWGALRFAGTWRGAWWVAAGILIAAWTTGTGIGVAVVVLPVMLIAGFRRRVHFLPWLVAAALGTLPYVLLLEPYDSTPPNLLRLDMWLGMIGLPFGSLQYPQQLVVLGIVGMTTLGLGLALAWRIRRAYPLAVWGAPLACAAYGLLTLYQIAVFRDELGWRYSVQSVAFWNGVIGLALLLLLAARPPGAAPRTVGRGRLWAVGTLFGLAILFSAAGLDFMGKADYLWGRRPASESCLRQFAAMPAYCELYVIQWGGEYPERVGLLAQPLVRHNLNVFGARQTWTLQGDYVLDTVRVTELPGSAPVHWVEGHNGARVRADHFLRLNLRLPPPNIVEWRITLPPDVTRAELITAAGLAHDAPQDGGTVRFEVVLTNAEGKRDVRFSEPVRAFERGWKPIRADLRLFAGQTLTLTFAAHADGDAGAWALFQHPVIALERAPHAAPLVFPDAPFAPEASADDFAFDLADWQTQALTRTEMGWRVEDSFPSLVNAALPPICLGDYSHLTFRLRYIADNHRNLQILYRLRGGDFVAYDDGINMPLWNDGAWHTYTYPLRLLEVDPSAQLDGLALVLEAAQAGTVFQLEDVRLTRRLRSGTFCAA